MDIANVNPDDLPLHDKWWRMTNLYWIQDKKGNRVLFRPWFEQQDLYKNMHTLNLILKARQRGMTTFIQLYELDECLFTNDISAGVIAHTAQDASKFFTNKIKFAYDNLPPWLRDWRRADTSNKRELSFNNGSSIYVGTSHRSGTLQYLHISEYGILCAKWPEKANEVRAGALNTVAPGNVVWIESTAMGRAGHFYKLCEKARKKEVRGLRLTQMDWKFFFYPWYNAKEYRQPGHLNIPEAYQEYFEKFEHENDVHLDQEQRNWYYLKAEDQGEDMKPEFPGSPEEAFTKLIEGAIFGTQMRRAWDEGRICDVPHDDTEPVNVYWDLGHNDINAMWFHQDAGAMDHFIDYHEDRLVSLAHYIHVLGQLREERGYEYGTMYLPHDGAHRSVTSIDGSADEILRKHGYRTRVVERPLAKMGSIQAARRRFPTCRFDRKRCDKGLIHLESYQWTFDEENDTYRKTPKHNAASNGADAFQTFGLAEKLHASSGLWGRQFDRGDAPKLTYVRGKKRQGATRDYKHVL